MSLSSNLQCDMAHPQWEQRQCKVQKLVVEICSTCAVSQINTMDEF